MLPEQEPFKPYISSSQRLPELTFKAIVVGVILGGVFAAANVYVGMKAGLTVSASIPVAVMAVAIFRAVQRRAGKQSILESNMSQTLGSAGESLAAGVIFTLPALILWQLNPSWLEMTLIAMIGGCIGVLFMIPLRQYLIRDEHKNLPYPEGTACAEVLKAADQGGASARHVFMGLSAGAVYKFLMSGLGCWFHTPSIQFQRILLNLDISPSLLGVGYILGFRISAIMVGGSALSSILLIPVIGAYGDALPNLFVSFGPPVANMSVGEIWNYYIRYIGAGGVAFGGIITLIRSIPTMVTSVKLALGQFAGAMNRQTDTSERTDRDLPLIRVLQGLIVLIVLMWVLPFIPVNLAGGLMVIVFGLFFVTVSSRITGLIGSSSNPISGMTITTLLATGLLFAAMGESGDMARAGALTVGALVCIAAAIAGDASQDLKTGYIVGASPYKQQIGELIGVVTSAGVATAVVLALADRIGTAELPAPQATLMKLVVEGALEHNLPWGLIFIGMGIGAVVELFRIPSLPFAVGVYLPFATMCTVFVGGCARYMVQRKKRNDHPGILFGSGLIAGDAFVAIALALLIGFVTDQTPELMHMAGPLSGVLSSSLFAVCVFGGLVYWLYRSRDQG